MSTTQRYAHYVSRSLLHIGPIVFAVAVFVAIAIGWLNRNEGHLTAESGLGYWLGIAGSVLMLLLLLYPLRKRYRVLHGVGPVSGWFRIHMILGVLGPVLIVFHSNFRIGSLNSRAALFTMLTVVASGIVGRYLYSKVHKGLYGRHAELREMVTDLEALKEQIGVDLAGNPRILEDVDAFSQYASTPPSSIYGGVAKALAVGWRGRAARRRIASETRDVIAEAAHNYGWSGRQRRAHLRAVENHLQFYFAAAEKAARLALFERLFALWHVLHMPLFVLLALTVVIHIVAVHLY